jgi:hypothetical protein
LGYYEENKGWKMTASTLATDRRRWFHGKSRTSARKRGRSKLGKFFWRPRLEQLEARCLPSATVKAVSTPEKEAIEVPRDN